MSSTNSNLAGKGKGVDAVTGEMDMNGSEQHHDLKNQPGEKAEDAHTKDDMTGNDEAREAVSEAVKSNDSDTPMAAAMQDAIDEEE